MELKHMEVMRDGKEFKFISDDSPFISYVGNKAALSALLQIFKFLDEGFFVQPHFSVEKLFYDVRNELLNDARVETLLDLPIKKPYGSPSLFPVSWRNFDILQEPQKTGDDIRRLREYMQISQRKMAQCLGISVKTIRAWEGNYIVPNGAACRLLGLYERDRYIPLRYNFAKRRK